MHSHLPSPAKKNIETIAQLEQELETRRSLAEQVGNLIASFFGSFQFICAHAIFFSLWIAVNAGGLRVLSPFDPYPFALLGTVVGIEFIFLTTFVLMNQSYQARRQDRWAHLTLQAAFLTEREVTKNMRMLRLICRELKLQEPAADEELADLSKDVEVETMVGEIDKARKN